MVGWPLDYSLSPAMHNAALTQFGIPAVYRALRVSPDDWPEFARQLKTPGASPLEGFNVTVPHKERVLALACALTDTASLCGSANTMIRTPDGWRADNTDAPGLAEDLKALQMCWKDKNVVLAGAGGAARSALLTVATGSDRAQRVILVNRSRDRAEGLVKEFQSRLELSELVVCSDGAGALASADLIINATSLGLKPEDPVPVPLERIRSGMAVYDMVYHRETPLVRGARSVGARAAGGKGMLVNQGALAFERWFETDLKKVHYTPRLLREIMGRAFDAALNERTQP
ncbi:MAG: shikimate dehydrogenase [Elusimicrobia bacterium]|nr:shikimate dehydrogenase [Elusimicrobiota bacterium]